MELIELDARRDYKITTVRRMIAVYEHSDEPEEQKAYGAARIIMDKYQDIEIENYEAESKSIRLLLNEWEKEANQTTRETLNLAKLLKDLEGAANAFDDKFNTRSTATGTKEVFDTKSLKRELRLMYEDPADDILAMAKRTNSAFYIKLLDMVNNGRSYFADILAKRHGKGNGGDAPDPDPKA